MRFIEGDPNMDVSRLMLPSEREGDVYGPNEKRV
jgi:hypothetical protein